MPRSTPNLGRSDIAKDFAPIALTAIVPVILVVHPSLGVNSVSELIALAKRKPGQLFYATTGVSTTLHLAGVNCWTLGPASSSSTCPIRARRKP